MSKTILLNQNWIFSKEGHDEPVTLPHTWNAIDDKNTTTAILFEQIVQQPVVLETFYRDYLSAKRRPSAKVGEQRFHDVNIFLIDVTKLGSIVFHRLNIQLLREFSVYRAMWAVGKIINC